MNTTRAWLDAHSMGVPQSLQHRMNAAVADAAATTAEDVASQLGAAALSCLRAATIDCTERPAALHLLAADALLTHACAAAAEQGPDALAALCAAFAPARLATAIGADRPS